MELTTKDEKSLLLYLETRAVDYSGRVDGRHMNNDDMKIAKGWSESGFIRFGRLLCAEIRSLQERYGKRVSTHWVELTDEAWQFAHKLRKEKAIRTMAKEGRNEQSRVGVKK